MRKDFHVRSNLHTHTCFGDGAHTPEEIVLTAINAKMEVLGFSEHCYTGIDDVDGMKKENVVPYRAEIERLRRVYDDRIRVLLGIEQDFYAGIPHEQYDYVIGSIHYVCLDDKYCPVDASAAVAEQTVREHCGNDFLRYARAYYDNVSDVYDRTHCNIVGHFDLLTKFNEENRMFREDDPRYVSCALEAVDCLLEKDVIFEVNTGAISRGYRKTPYPAPFILKRISEKNGSVTLSSDAHDKECLLYAFDDALDYVRAYGVQTVMTMTRNGWESRRI